MPHVHPARLLRASALILLAGFPLQGSPANSAALPRQVQQVVQNANLTCAVSTPRGRPLTFDPPLSLIQDTITMHGRLALTDCTTRNKKLKQLRSGQFAFNGSSKSTCTSAQAIHGQGTITWHDAHGHTIGTSTLRPTLRHITTYNPGDVLLGGTVTRGLMSGARVAGSATPTSNVSGCLLGGLHSIQGSGKVTFRA
ncbi:hypothetical protein [Streptomyces sp. WZ-12]|uniref:hypothetical protein n=1 Tax=Streptomyces sp. WZ-12 TaxID=3030210 RepID=UPI0023813ABC|nr:hypothetical protein [Streptomyces sp. WZ-12]